MIYREEARSVAGRSSVDSMTERGKVSALTLQPRESSESRIADALFCSWSSFVLVSRSRPNKSPEPTRGAVTPRAIERKSEMALQTEIRHAARGAPAPRVAHL